MQEKISIGKVFDQTFTLIFKKFFTVFFLGIFIHGIPTFIAATRQIAPEMITVGQYGTVALFSWIMQVFCAGASLHIFRSYYKGGELSWKNGFSETLSDFFPILGTMLLVALMIFGGFILLVIPGFIALTGLTCALPIIVYERSKIGAAISRSFELTKGNRWRILGILFLFGLFQGVLIAGTAFLTAFVSSLEGMDGISIGVAVASLVAAPLWVVPWFIEGSLYYQLREIKEGIDIEDAA